MGAPADDVTDRVRKAAEAYSGGPAVNGGKKKGGIQCFALVDRLLKSVGAKTAEDFGEVTPNADYVWGEAVEIKDVRPGYILQFRNHEITKTTYTLGKVKWEASPESPARRPHHTAVVVEVLQDGSVIVIEQYVRPDVHKVWRDTILRLASGSETRYRRSTEKVDIMVTGSVTAYRPVRKTE
jgi:cell wall-associated NlpC family hydrolase